MSEYQAIVFDLDGTAIQNSPDAMPSARLIRTVEASRDKIHLVAATGRPVHQALPIITALGLNNPCIISGGAVIIDPATQEILKITTLPPAAVHAILDLVKHHPYALFHRAERISTGAANLHPSKAIGIEIIYIALVPADDLPGIMHALSEIDDISASAVTDWSDAALYAINVTHVNATKEHAVADVLDRLGVSQAAAIGIGDGNNDLHLFRSVGLKVAMGNASPDLKAAADHIAPTIDEDGLASIIERFA